MKVLVACEYSGRVRDGLGHDDRASAMHIFEREWNALDNAWSA